VSAAGPNGGIDPRGPRFTAAITAVVALAVVALAAGGLVVPALVVLGAQAALFAVGAIGGVARHPLGLVYRRIVRPRLGPPAALEDPAGPTFAQGVGLAIALAGVVLGALGVPGAVLVAAALVFVAALLNSAFDVCLGCLLHALLVRVGVLGRRAA
jgi:hypothetical protein